MRILLIEDELKIAHALKRGLERDSCAVDVITDGQEDASFLLAAGMDSPPLFSRKETAADPPRLNSNSAEEESHHTRLSRFVAGENGFPASAKYAFSFGGSAAS